MTPQASQSSARASGSHPRNFRPASELVPAVLDQLSAPLAPSSRKADLIAYICVLLSFLVGLAISWQRWGNPLIDLGRELNVPLRLIHGQSLYADVGYHYGPLSPYLNAVLYRAFQPSLWLLWIRGMAVALPILLLVYWIARQISGLFTAALAAVAITWICALKPQGNYVMPYAYPGLDGCLLLLTAVAASILWMKKKSPAWLVLSSVLAGLAILAKTEMGLIAVMAGIMASLLAGFPRPRTIILNLLVFLVPALAIPVAVFWRIASRVGWRTLLVDNHVFFGHVPRQFLYFNALRFGFDHPLHSFSLMLASFAQIIAFAALLAAISLLLNSQNMPGKGRVALLFFVSLSVILLTAIYLKDLGPFLSMPFFLAGLFLAATAAFFRAYRNGQSDRQLQAAILVLLVFSALVSLSRMFLRVSTGGALSSFLLPLSVILFVDLWISVFPLFISSAEARLRAQRLISAVLCVAVLVTAVTVSVRYRRKYSYPIVSARGTWLTTPEVGPAFSQAYAFILAKTSPDAPVAAIPEGTSLLFLTGRRNPLHDEIIVPGFLDASGEERAIADLRASGTPLILVANRPTPEYGERVFGSDYDVALLSWITQNYSSCAVFPSSPGSNPQMGDPRFFIRAFCRNHLFCSFGVGLQPLKIASARSR